MVNKKNCVGCRNNFYNGNNDIGVKQCWQLETAKMVMRYSISWWTPMNEKDGYTKVRVPDCYHQPGQTAYVDAIPHFAK